MLSVSESDYSYVFVCFSSETVLLSSNELDFVNIHKCDSYNLHQKSLLATFRAKLCTS